MLVNTTKDNTVLATNIIVANTFFKRLKGLLGEKSLSQNSALILSPCAQIHSYFMRFEFDVVFVNHNWEVVYLIERMQPNNVSPLIKSTCKVIELPAGTIINTNTVMGDILSHNPRYWEGGD